MTGLPLMPPNTDETEAALTAIYNWNYDSEIDQVRTRYANALDRQWIAVRDLDWDQRGPRRGLATRPILAERACRARGEGRERDPIDVARSRRRLSPQALR